MDSLTDGGAVTDTDSPLTPVETGMLDVTEREAAPEEDWGEEVFVQAVVDVNEDDDDFQEFEKATGPASEVEVEVEVEDGVEDVQGFEEAVLGAEAVPDTVAEVEAVSNTDVGIDGEDEFQGFEEAPVSTAESVEEPVSESESEDPFASIEPSPVTEPKAAQEPICDELAIELTVKPSEKDPADEPTHEPTHEPTQDQPVSEESEEAAQGAGGSASYDEIVPEPTKDKPQDKAVSDESKEGPSDEPTSEPVVGKSTSDSPDDESTEEPEDEDEPTPTSAETVVDGSASYEPEEGLVDEPVHEPVNESVGDEPVADGGDQKDHDDDDDDWGDDDFQDFDTAVPSVETSAEIQAASQTVSAAETKAPKKDEEDEDEDWGDEAFQEFEEAEASAPATPVAVSTAVSTAASSVPAPTAVAAVRTCTFHPGMWAFTAEAVDKSADYAEDRDALLALLQRSDQLDPATVASVNVLYPQLRAVSSKLFGAATACVFASEMPVNSPSGTRDDGDCGGDGEVVPPVAPPLPVLQRSALGDPDFTAWARRMLLDAILDTVPYDAAPLRNDRESPMPHRRRRRYSSGEAFDVGKSLDDDPAVLSKAVMPLSTAAATTIATLSSPASSPRHQSPTVSSPVTPTLAHVSETVETAGAPSQQSGTTGAPSQQSETTGAPSQQSETTGAPSQQSEPEPVSEPVSEPVPEYSIDMGLDFLASMTSSSSSSSSKPQASAHDDPLGMFFGGASAARNTGPALSAQIPQLASPTKSFGSEVVSAAASSSVAAGSAAPLSSKAEAFLNGLPNFSYILPPGSKF